VLVVYFFWAKLIIMLPKTLLAILAAFTGPAVASLGKPKGTSEHKKHKVPAKPTETSDGLEWILKMPYCPK